MTWLLIAIVSTIIMAGMALILSLEISRFRQLILLVLFAALFVTGVLGIHG